MPRKPFRGFYQPGMAYDIGPDAIAKRPELAALVGQCIAMWSDVELQMALSLGAILKTNSDAAVALFLAIKTSKAQMRNDMFVYERQDLKELLCNLMELQKAVFFFHCYHQPREKTKDYLKDMLSIRQIQKALQVVQRKREAIR